MPERKTGRLKVWYPLLFSLILVGGMVLGFNLRDSLRQKRNIQTVILRNDRLEQIIDLINEKYVDSINTNLLYKDAVDGIVSHLDPHTSYIPVEDIAMVNESLEGSFFGIGVEFSIVRDTIQVTSVIENGPAYRSKVKVGDQLIKVEDSIVAGTGITSDKIIDMLKGKQYSQVNITFKDAATEKLKTVTIERDAIPIYSVDASVMLDSATGYIKINRFSANTYDEFLKALKSLKGKGMKKLVLDLRQNPGGYLDAATMIADEFLAGNKLLVYTEGRKSPRYEYRAGEEGMFEEGKLTILVDESSASASEILAGAVQDWDRGVIVGRRTFGKGLVQEQYELEDGSALRLTVARYYTPSGRSIQRSYSEGKEAYAEDWVTRFRNGELTGEQDSLINVDTTRYYTSNKRLVYGGGGIAPDITVPYDTTRLSRGVIHLLYSEELRVAIWDYFLKNRSRLTDYKTVQAFDKQFLVEKDLIDAFFNSYPADRRKLARKVLATEENAAYFKMQVKARLARFIFGSDGYYYITAKEDNVVQEALKVMKEKGSNSKYSHIVGG